MADSGDVDASRTSVEVTTRPTPLMAAAFVVFLASCNCSRSASPGPSVAKPTKKALSGPRVGSSHNGKSPVGTNLSGIADWSSEIPFIDLFKSSRPWISGRGEQFDDGRPISTDDSGWIRSLLPGQVARTLMLWDVKHYPAGRYVVLYDGEGEISYASSAANRLVEAESAPGRHVLDVDPKRGEQGIHLIVEKTNPSNPVRNIRVLLPGGSCEIDPTTWCDAKETCSAGACIPFEKNHDKILFNPRFVERLQSYSVLRFMDWGAINDSEVVSWAKRPLLSDARWVEDGAPVEVMVALAHRVKAEPWFNIPHRADDAYVRQMATTVKNLLKPEYRLWVEFSNEVWNGQFAQHNDVRACPASAKTDGPYQAALLCYSERAKRVLSIWGDVFGRDLHRLVRVLASQSANPWTSEQILDHQGAHKYADALAIAPYFGVSPSPEEAAAVAKLSVAELLANTLKNDIPETIKLVEEHYKIAKKRDLALVAYEGGQHFVGTLGAENNEALNKLFDAANRSPRLAKLYRTYLDGWRQAGGRLFVNYTSCGSYTKWSRFGILEYVTQPRKEAPKFDAVQGFIENNPRWW